MLQHFIGPVEEESEDKDDEEEGLLGGPGQVADEVDLFEEVYGRQVEDEGEEEESAVSSRGRRGKDKQKRASSARWTFDKLEVQKGIILSMRHEYFSF